jgi:hypothetical protein
MLHYSYAFFYTTTTNGSSSLLSLHWLAAKTISVHPFSRKPNFRAKASVISHPLVSQGLGQATIPSPRAANLFEHPIETNNSSSALLNDPDSINFSYVTRPAGLLQSNSSNIFPVKSAIKPPLSISPSTNAKIKLSGNFGKGNR